MEYFKGAMLSSWNSFYGPKVEQLWLSDDHALYSLPKEKCAKIKNFDVIKDRYSFLNINQHEAINELNIEDELHLIDSVDHALVDFKKYLRMTGKLLLSEMESKRPFMENSSRIYHLENKIIFAVVFYNRLAEDSQELDNTCLSICVMLSYSDFSYTLKYQNVFDLHLRKIVSIIQKSSTNKEHMVAEVSKLLEDLYGTLNVLNKDKNDLQAQRLPRFSQFQLRAKFLGRSIVSHMETSGCSVIVGTSKFTVNQLAHLLLLFNTKKEKSSSAPLLEDPKRTYHRGLCVQGLIRDYNEGQSSLPDDCFSESPLTIIDTDSYKVRQSFNTQASELNSNALMTVTNSGKLIPQLLDDLFLFEEHKWPTDDIFNSLLRCIDIKAAALIKIVERYRREGSATTEKQAMNLLNVCDAVDFKIYVGSAEKLKPGIRAALV